jgi:thiosulfate reductase cytochrome b subunit
VNQEPRPTRAENPRPEGRGEVNPGHQDSPPGEATPAGAEDYRRRPAGGEDVTGPRQQAGSLPAARGIAPRVRVGRDRWLNLLWLIPAGWAVLIVAAAAASGLRNIPVVQRFIAYYPGTLPVPQAPEGLPWWVDAQHFLNALLMIFIIQSGLQVLADRHAGLPGLRHSTGLARWWHLGADVLWLLNGVVFYLLLAGTGQWRRIVPTTWQVFPSAASVAIQYLSLRWPVDNSWAAYNSLELLAYFTTVFVAAPLALVTGLGMSPALAARFKPASGVLSVQAARSLHFLVLCWFGVFIVIHVTLVFTTGLLRNLNHIYAVRDDSSWIGFGVFCVATAILAAAWVAATQVTLRHPRAIQRAGSALTGPAQRLFEDAGDIPGEHTGKDASPPASTGDSLPALAVLPAGDAVPQVHLGAQRPPRRRLGQDTRVARVPPCRVLGQARPWLGNMGRPGGDDGLVHSQPQRRAVPVPGQLPYPAQRAQRDPQLGQPSAGDAGQLILPGRKGDGGQPPHPGQRVGRVVRAAHHQERALAGAEDRDGQRTLDVHAPYCAPRAAKHQAALGPGAA